MFEEDQKTVWETVFPTNGIGRPVVLEGGPAPNTSLGLRSCFPGVQVEAFVLCGTPEALDEDVVELTGFGDQHTSDCSFRHCPIFKGGLEHNGPSPEHDRKPRQLPLIFAKSALVGH